eukprot:Phypoly_transcript_20607.p1 GENE.Phypoly_transcript_20607~~Phypoly_transcript_20607.p1  ORF type:complete len:120 (+),score=16.44 Phypoly_transcript_20607:246-605(+)
MSEINQLKSEIAELKAVVERLSKRPAFIRVRGDRALIKNNNLNLVSVIGNVYTFAFDAPRSDDNYGVLTNVHQTAFWRTWGRVTNITKNGFDVHFLTEKNEKISDPTLEVTVLVCTDCE